MTDRIAVDVMGGDDAPRAVLQGLLQACQSGGETALDPTRLLLVGDQERVEAELAQLASEGHAVPDFAIQHASQVIDMHDSPAAALRSKPDSSIAVCVGSVKAGAAGAVVSMGNTGACVGAATLGLGTLEGVRRPGIAVGIDLTGSPMVLLDMGANVAPKPEHLVQYGLMGRVFAESCLGVQAARVGLLNIGEESSKGTDLTKSAFEGMSASEPRFVGNVEPSELFDHRADVVVTDGFTGNVVLKLMEGFAGFLFGLFTQELASQGASWAKESMGRLAGKIDYSEYGGALLLGVRGVVVIGHGRSDANAVSNALGVAARALDQGLNERIVAGLSEAAARA